MECSLRERNLRIPLPFKEMILLLFQIFLQRFVLLLVLLVVFLVFQLHFSDSNIRTPGDAPDVLIAMNAAALKRNFADVKAGGTIIINTDKMKPIDLKKVFYESNPLEDDSLEDYHVVPIPLSSLSAGAVTECGLNIKEF